ncbi:hypothetical protein TC41_1757 [Alicyclobacillus acidocaldarius subsp. acidocaldarius Tc-4-1]|uniref:Uncharacterized protein n=1 Tax=Alicyclobacillus acidocaldarius (strain Tc-4-1) TaxID=1048834 RepID=F8ILB7_ALIAT|nr:hypothetical protein TC41_1757 [Alicyclobacillus acidocaldarius subsp. acidocaldarius Tc-4-1]
MESSETFQITWAGATVSASPTQLPVGQVSTITVNANAPGRTVTLYSTAPVIQGEQPSETCTTKGCHSNGNYQITVNDTGTTTLQAVSNTAQVVKFWVTTTPPNPPSPTDVGQGTTSPTVTVAWGNNTGVSITLMATPGSTTYGGTITESYSVQGWQPGDEVIIQVVNESPATPAEASGTYFPNGWYSSGYCTASGCVYQAVLTEPSASHNESEQPVTLEAGIGGSVTDQGDTLTITYQAEVVNADGQLLATSNEITPTWVPPQSTTQPSPTPTPPAVTFADTNAESEQRCHVDACCQPYGVACGSGYHADRQRDERMAKHRGYVDHHRERDHGSDGGAGRDLHTECVGNLYKQRAGNGHVYRIRVVYSARGRRVRHSERRLSVESGIGDLDKRHNTTHSDADTESTTHTATGSQLRCAVRLKCAVDQHGQWCGRTDVGVQRTDTGIQRADELVAMR